MSSPHTFHIPVMGLAYTIDSPIKVARFGISSVISIVEDNLIELMRKYYYQQTGKNYVPISTNETDYRERRITDYLNLVNEIVQEQISKLKASAFEAQSFEAQSDLVKYFEMLPDNSFLKQAYRQMAGENSMVSKVAKEDWLKEQLVPGAIDVNIMTKVDKDNFGKDGAVLENGSDALSALRGFMNSNLTNSSIIFSAGMNPRLFNYLENFDQLLPKNGAFEKKIVIKVSDYRSALIQGKYLAKKGIWVSEFRVESGLNCGGHAFATDGFLLGPILQEFIDKKEELTEALFSIYKPVVEAKTGTRQEAPFPVKITVQGGIGTYEETRLLQEHFGIDATGWGSPFLLCPEATTVDDNTLQLLSAAGEEDIVLSKNSPLGVRFHYLKGNGAEKEKHLRISKGKPGSPCTEKHLVSNTEFTKEPICTASYKYQKLKLAQLETLGLTDADLQKQKQEVLDKECLCVGLSNAAAIKYNVPFLKRQEEVTICPGPNTAYFNHQVTLQQMTDHIYGRTNIVDSKRPHLFIKELSLYVAYLKEMVTETLTPDAKRIKYINTFYTNLCNGIAYYESKLDVFFDGNAKEEKQVFAGALEKFKREIRRLVSPFTGSAFSAN